NARLGWWLGSPGPAGNDTFWRAGPRFAVRPLVFEAFGLTDEVGPHVYLSVGGHFENIGLYEIVLRRCHCIVVSDAGCGPYYGFEDHGNAVRKIRIDLGLPIRIEGMSVGSRERAQGLAEGVGRYCAIGTIGYRDVDPDGVNGILIYIKPAFYGREPMDI